jgi:hypothetical protein
MSHDIDRDDDVSFGERLLGMQGFDAERARRYRGEMERLLVHRISRYERWMLGIPGTMTGAALLVSGIMMFGTGSHSETPGAAVARWTTAITCAATGLLMGIWLLRVAIAGGYARRAGDVMGMVIVIVFCGGWAAGLVQYGLAIDNADLRRDLLVAGSALFVALGGCLLVAFLQRMHRQTQEKLLRIEYHLAELMERRAA